MAATPPANRGGHGNGRLLYVAPISGGFSPNQLELIAQLCDIGVQPDLAMGTSGGNMAIYIALLCNWDRRQIADLVNSMNDSFVVTPWARGALSLLPTAVWGVLKGSLYNHGTADPFGGRPVVDLANAVEVWTSVFSKTQCRTSVWCNRSPGQTQLTYTSRDLLCLPPKYCAGDYERLRQVVQASGSVPGVQREVTIDSESYIDGGVTYASPFVLFTDNLRQLAKEKSLHIVYLNCSNPAKPATEQRREGIISDAMQAVSLLTSGHILSDMAAVLSFLRTCPQFDQSKELMRRELRGGPANLRGAVEFLAQFPVTVLELAPVFNRSIDYTNFSPDEFKSVMFLCGENYTLRMHWFT